MNKELNRTIKFLKKNRVLAIKTIIPVVIFCLVVTIIGILSPKPNDNISPSNKGYLFENRNPRFNVGFGVQEKPDKSYVRFEAKVDTKNPFDEQKSSIWDSITRIFTKRKGFEFGLSEVRFGETDTETSKKLRETIGDAIDQMEIDNIFTDTEVIEVGRLLGEEDSNDVSKQTVINKNVYPGIDLEYQILEGLGVKEEIVVRDIEEYTANCGSDIECLLPLNEFVFDLKLDEGVSLKRYQSITKEDNTPNYYLVDSNDNYIAHFLPTFAVDYVGSKTYAVDLVINHIDENNYEVVVTLEADWLFSNDRVFPIRIDPSIVHDTTTEFDTGSDYNTEVVAGPKLQLQEQEIYNVIDDNVLGYWKLNESSGTGAYILDSSGNGYHGTPTGTAFAEGKFRGARDFVGTDGEKISIGDITAFEANTFTVEAYFKKEGTCNFNHCTIFSKGSTGLEGYNFAINNSSLQIRVNDGGDSFTQVLTGSTSISNNVWYHAAAVVNSTTGSLKLYLNGNLEASGSFTETITYGTAPVRIGNANSNEDLWFNGVLDEIRFSNVERSAEEISNYYISKTHGAHTSAELDLEQSSDIESIAWTSIGDDTGDGETPYSTTGLVGQWDFNETSGTTADNEGSCGASCDGTLTNMTTTGQDVVASSGWTSDNRRWGSGAIMFDGTDDYVNTGTSSNLNIYNSPLTLEAWIKTSYSPSFPDAIIQRMENAMGASGYSLEINDDGTLSSYYYYSGSGPTLTSNKAVNDGEWHHIVATFSSTDYAIYIDGQLDVQSGGGYPTSGSTATLSLNIGKFSEAPDGYYQGVIDSVRVYSRSLSALEILSNYQSGNIEMRYRTSSDGSIWSDWSGTETSIEDFEDNYLYDTSDAGLVSYWPLDEENSGTIYDVAGSNNGTTSSVRTLDGKSGNSIGHQTGSSATVPDSTSLDITGNLTMEYWFKPDVDVTNMTSTYPIGVFKRDYNVGGYGSHFSNTTGKVNFQWCWSGACSSLNSNTTFNAGQWYHYVATYNGSVARLYINGKEDNSLSVTNAMASSSGYNLSLGRDSFEGAIDEVRIYNTALSASDIFDNWTKGNSTNSSLRKSTNTNNIEGSSALELDSAGYGVDGNTAGYWKLDETSGSGAYLKDSSPNGNDGTPTGTTFIKDGKVGGARSFNGSEYISLGNPSSLQITGDQTIEMWLKPTDFSLRRNPYAKAYGGEGTITQETNGSLNYYYGTAGGNATPYQSVNSGQTLSLNEWNHVVIVRNLSSMALTWYINGQMTSSAVASYTSATASSLTAYIGTGYTNPYSGEIDQVRVSNIARSSEEIYDSYMFGKDKYISKSTSSTDLSSNSILPFWIASDEIGSNMDLMYGESEYANSEPDENTLGMWHMDNYFFEDSSGYNNDRSSYYGVEYGIQASNITWIANQWNGAANNGEIDMTCPGGDSACYIVTHSGRTLSTPSINYGVAMQEAAAIQAYIMYSPSLSAQGITPLANNSNNFVGVRYNVGWQYDNNTSWVSFTPNRSNIIVATLTTGNTAVTNLHELDYPSFIKEGKFAGAINFNGVEDWVELGNLGDPSAGTIEFWVNLDASNTGSQYLLDGRDTGNWWLLQDYASGACVDTEGNICFNGQVEISSSNISNNTWHYVAITANSTETKAYIDGKLVSTGTGLDPSFASVRIGTRFTNSSYLSGSMDEVRISNIARTPDEIRQAYEVGRRTHPIKVDFKASLQSSNLITGSTDTSFTISEQDYGAFNPIEHIDVGEKIIVKENIGGTEYIAQGDLSTVNTDTGAVTVSSWDSGSTFPTSGFTVNATVFKWQREYMDIRYPLDEDIDNISRLTFRKKTDVPSTFWIDDAKKATYVYEDLSGSNDSVPDEVYDFEDTTFPPNAEWSTSGEVNWYRDESQSYSGSASAASGTITHSQTSLLEWETNVEQPSDLSFFWKVSSETGYDFLVFCHNNSTCTRTSGYEQRVSGEVGWSSVKISLDPGVHSFLWGYFKDSSVSSGSDKGWLDNVRLVAKVYEENVLSIVDSEDVNFIQYQPIFTRWNNTPSLDLYLSEVTINYTSGPTMEQTMRHGKWFNSSGEKQPFWWATSE